MKYFGTRQISFSVAILFFLIVLLLNPFHLSPAAAKVLAVAVLMVTLWVTEVLSMPVVALIPLIMFPLLGIANVEEAAAPYANPVIFLFMGGFIIGLAVEKWGLHKRIALNIISFTGTSGNRIILGFILATGFLSMWLSNTATTMMMYPIAMSVITVMESNQQAGNIKNMTICLLLAIAYASNFGGIATIIGTPTNVAFVAFLEKKYNYSFEFLDWMLFCIPLSILLLLSLYWVLVKLVYPNHIKRDENIAGIIRTEKNILGNMQVTERRVAMVFALTALLWITRDLINKSQSLVKLDDTLIAIFGAFLLFVVPSKSGQKESPQLLQWSDTNKMAWGILLLFGGGISLAAQMEKAGLMQLLGNWIAAYSGSNILLLVFTVSLISIFVSELISNTAQVIVFAPVMAGIADAMGMNPLLLGLPMTLAASCAGMLPMGTPPNAIVFGSGKLLLKDMLKTGLIMNLIAVLLITLFSYFLLPLLVSGFK